MKRNQPKSLMLGKTKSHYTYLTKSKFPGGKASKIVFLGGSEEPVLLKNNREGAFLNSWQSNYLGTKETSSLYNLNKKSQTTHQLQLLRKGSRALFSKMECSLDVLVVRAGWVSCLTQAKRLIGSKMVKVNETVAQSPLKILSVGSTMEVEKPDHNNLCDLTFLPHLMNLSPSKMLLSKEPEFCPELIFYDLSKGLRNLC